MIYAQHKSARTDGVPALGQGWHSCSSSRFVPTPLGWLALSAGLIVLAQYSSQLRSWVSPPQVPALPLCQGRKKAGSFGLAHPVCQHKWARSVCGPAVLVQPLHCATPSCVTEPMSPPYCCPALKSRCQNNRVNTGAVFKAGQDCGVKGDVCG